MMDQDCCNAVISIYSQLLSDVAVLSTAYKSAHLNVRGDDFYQYHLLFERVGNDFDNAIDIDKIGERIGSIDNMCIIPVSVALATKNSQIIKQCGDIPASQSPRLLIDYLIKATCFLVDFCCTSSKYLASIGANTDANKLQEYEINIAHNLYLLKSVTYTEM